MTAGESDGFSEYVGETELEGLIGNVVIGGNEINLLKSMFAPSSASKASFIAKHYFLPPFAHLFATLVPKTKPEEIGSTGLVLRLIQ